MPNETAEWTESTSQFSRIYNLPIKDDKGQWIIQAPIALAACILRPNQTGEFKNELRLGGRLSVLYPAPLLNDKKIQEEEGKSTESSQQTTSLEKKITPSYDHSSPLALPSKKVPQPMYIKKPLPPGGTAMNSEKLWCFSNVPAHKLKWHEQCYGASQVGLAPFELLAEFGLFFHQEDVAKILKLNVPAGVIIGPNGNLNCSNVIGYKEIQNLITGKKRRCAGHVNAYYKLTPAEEEDKAPLTEESNSKKLNTKESEGEKRQDGENEAEDPNVNKVFHYELDAIEYYGLDKPVHVYKPNSNQEEDEIALKSRSLDSEKDAYRKLMKDSNQEEDEIALKSRSLDSAKDTYQEPAKNGNKFVILVEYGYLNPSLFRELVKKAQRHFDDVLDSVWHVLSITEEVQWWYTYKKKPMTYKERKFALVTSAEMSPRDFMKIDKPYVYHFVPDTNFGEKLSHRKEYLVDDPLYPYCLKQVFELMNPLEALRLNPLWKTSLIYFICEVQSINYQLRHESMQNRLTEENKYCYNNNNNENFRAWRSGVSAYKRSGKTYTLTKEEQIANQLDKTLAQVLSQTVILQKKESRVMQIKEAGQEKFILTQHSGKQQNELKFTWRVLWDILLDHREPGNETLREILRKASYVLDDPSNSFLSMYSTPTLSRKPSTVIDLADSVTQLKMRALLARVDSQKQDELLRYSLRRSQMYYGNDADNKEALASPPSLSSLSSLSSSTSSSTEEAFDSDSESETDNNNSTNNNPIRAKAEKKIFEDELEVESEVDIEAEAKKMGSKLLVRRSSTP